MKRILLIILTIMAAHTLTIAGFSGSLQTTWTPSTIFKEVLNGTTVTGEFTVSVTTLSGTAYSGAATFYNAPNGLNPPNEVVVSILSGFYYTTPKVVTSVVGYTINLGVNTFTGTLTGQFYLSGGSNAYQGNVPYTFVVYDSAEPTVVVTQPQSETLCGGNLSNLTVSATGTGTLSYLWSDGSTNPTLNTSISGNYKVTVTGLGGKAVSSVANVFGNTSIITQPISQSICSGTSSTLSVSATGINLSYLWSSGETSSSITKSAGNYTVTVSGNCGTAISTTVGISLKTNTAINALPSTITVCTGLGLSLNASALGENLSFQWSKNGTTLPNTTNQISIVSASLSDAGTYQVAVTGTCGSVSGQVQVSISGCNSITTINSSNEGKIDDVTVSIYPNPTTGSFTIDAATYTSAEIINLFGEVVQTISLTGKTQVNLASKGLYLVRLYSNTDSKLVKINVE